MVLKQSPLQGKQCIVPAICTPQHLRNQFRASWRLKYVPSSATNYRHAPRRFWTKSQEAIAKSTNAWNLSRFNIMSRRQFFRRIITSKWPSQGPRDHPGSAWACGRAASTQLKTWRTLSWYQSIWEGWWEPSKKVDATTDTSHKNSLNRWTLKGPLTYLWWGNRSLVRDIR